MNLLPGLLIGRRLYVTCLWQSLGASAAGKGDQGAHSNVVELHAANVDVLAKTSKGLRAFNKSVAILLAMRLKSSNEPAARVIVCRAERVPSHNC